MALKNDVLEKKDENLDTIENENISINNQEINNKENTKTNSEPQNKKQSSISSKEKKEEINSSDSILINKEQDMSNTVEDNNSSNSSEKENSTTSQNSSSEYKPLSSSKTTSVTTIFVTLVIVVFSILLILYAGFTIYNMFNNNIISGVSIKGVDVSNLSQADAKYQLDNLLSSNIPEEITIKHGDFTSTISLTQMEAKFDTGTASKTAYEVGRQGNIFENNLYVLSTMFNKVNIEPDVNVNEDLLSNQLQKLSTQLPDTVIQSRY